MRVLAVIAVAAALIVFAAPAMASPVATNDGAYAVLGRVFPDPLANCQHSGGSVCSGNAQGNVPATQFIGIDEFVNAIKYMNGPSTGTGKDWHKYMEIVPLDGKLGDGAGNGRSDVAGNDLPPEFTPDKDFVSAGIPTSALARKKSDLMVVRVTDESVPDAGKKRYALSLSIHGIERAGAEGGIRAMEDLVTAHSTDLLNKPIVPAGVKAGAPTFGEVLKKTIIYFTLPNPDGWRRGSVSSGPDGGVFFQRYNGNGVDPNRDWPDIGYAFRGYSAVSEPETKSWISFYDQVRKNGGPFAAGDDLHGQPEADALSYTLLPHGRHRWDKNARIADTAKLINRSTFDRINWSPIVQANDQPQGGAPGCVPGPLGANCAKIYGQTWGSVYDTINYTTTGALGDWFDSSLGLRADGIDNEMSFSHLDKNITFDPHTEQLHVDGNKALIYAHLANIIEPPASPTFDVGGRKGYVPNLRVSRGATASQPEAPPGSVPQDDEKPAPNLVDPTGPGTAFTFPVKRGLQPDGKNIFNGGMRVEVTTANAQGIGTGLVSLKIQCQHCDEHPGVKDNQEWVTVAEDFNQSFLYAQSGVTATVNHPQPYARDGKVVPWRALVTGPAGVAQVVVHFTSGRASEDGDTGGGTPPEQRAYDVANTDFFKDLNPFIFWLGQEMNPVDPRAVIDGTQSLDSFDTIALADDPLPGYNGQYGGAAAHPSGSPTADFTFSGSVSAPGGGSGAPGTSEEKTFTIAPGEANKRATIKITWVNGANDFDLYVYRVNDDGTRSQVGSSTGSPPATAEEAIVVEPIPGNYVIEVQNYAAGDPTWQGTAKFTPYTDPPASSSKFTEAEKDTWFNKLKTWVQGGGNLVLTDGALRALPELTGLPADKIAKQTVYAGQSAFSTGTGDTLKDPLAKDVAQPGARFNTGMRRQMFEPTPLGFAIQNTLGADSSFAQQFDVARAAWEAAGGRTVATSADAGARNAKAVTSRVTIGELKIGQGDIRIAGALLPQPIEEFDHQFGLEPYATTYTGYTMARNLLQPIPSRAGNGAGNAGGGTGGGGGGGTGGGGGGTGGGGGGPGGGGTAGGVNTVGGRFIISTKLVRLKDRRARVHVSCRAPSGCRGTLKLQGWVEEAGEGRPEHRPFKATLGTAKFNYKRKRDAVITVKLSKRLARLVSRVRRTKVTATAPVRFGDGRKGVARAKFWLYRR